MENILISFTADTEALDVINQKLGTVKQNLQGLVTGGSVSSGSASPTGASGSTSSGSSSAAAANQKKAIDDITKSNQILLKSNDDLQKKYNDLAKQFQAYQDTIKSSTAGGTQSINAMADAQKKVNAQIGDATATQSFRTQLKLMRQEITALALDGQKGSDRYNELVAKAGELQQAISHTKNTIGAMGSDTQAFDSILAGTQMVAGGFSIMEGAAVLAGGADQDLQKQMAKLQAVIAITIGVQQVATTVTKEGALMTGIATMQEWARTTAQKLGTESTIAATIAQKALNLVAEANPYILLATGVLAVVAAVLAWNAGTEAEIEKQKMVNDLETSRIESLQRINDSYKEAGVERERVLSNEIELMKAQNKSQTEVAAAEKKLRDERLANAAGDAGRYSPEIAALEENKDKVIDLAKALEKLKAAKDAGIDDVTFSVGTEFRAVKVTDEEKDQLQKELDNLKLTVKIGTDSKEGLANAKQAAKVGAAQDTVTKLKNAREDSIAVAQIRIEESRKGSAQELAAHIELVAAQLRLDLDNASLTATQKKEKMIKADKDIADAKRAFAVSELEDDKSVTNAKLLLSKKGSEDENNLKKQLLNNQMAIDLADINLSEKKKAEIHANYLAQQLLIDKEFNDKKSTSELNAEISLIESELAGVRAGSNEEYQLQVELIEKKRALDVKSAVDSITNEKERAAKIIDINAKAQQTVIDLKYSKEIEGINKLSALQTLAASQDYASGKISKSQFELEKLKITKDALTAEIAVRGKYSKEAIDLEQKLADQEIALAEKVKATKQQVIKESFNTVSMIGNLFYDGEKEHLNQQLSDLDHYYTTDVAAAKANKNLKLISEAEYNSRQLKLKRDIAKADQKQSIFNVVMSTIEAVAGTLAQKPIGIWNIVLAAIMGVQGAIQIAKIKSTPLPAYAKGRKGGQGEMAWVGEQGPEMMWVPPGAAILPAHKSNKVRDAIGIMKEYNIPALPYISNKAIEQAKISNAGMNYKMLAKEIGDQMESRIRFPKIPGQRPVSINVDHTGTTVRDGDTTTHYRNRKYVGNV